MTPLKLSSLAQAVAICAGALVFAGTAGAADKGDKATYEQAKASAKAAYDTDKHACDAMSGNAKDICVAEAKAKRVRVDENAEAAYKNTPKAREHATHEIAATRKAPRIEDRGWRIAIFDLPSSILDHLFYFLTTYQLF